jgi:hypothetical protein
MDERQKAFHLRDNTTLFQAPIFQVTFFYALSQVLMYQDCVCRGSTFWVISF